jgi:hypothetical protein
LERLRDPCNVSRWEDCKALPDDQRADRENENDCGRRDRRNRNSFLLQNSTQLHRFIGRVWSSSSASSRSTPGMNRTRRSSNRLPRALLIYCSLASYGENFVEMVVALGTIEKGAAREQYAEGIGTV